VKWSPQQARALDAVAAWLDDPDAPQVFRLFGFAGSGKTTLARHFAESVRGRVVYCAFTGKAAFVMRRKGCVGAQTIHKTIYLPAGDPPSPAKLDELRAEIRRLASIQDAGAQATCKQLRDQLERAEHGRKDGPRFRLNVMGDLAGAALCVIDECSMVDRFVGADLESFGVKLLVLGDPAQLPPVFGAGYFTDREPDVLLDEIHRQALDSPILRLADLARRGQRLPYGTIGDGVEVLRYGDPSLEERALGAEMILVGRNRTRHGCNAKIRRLLGRPHDTPPTAGDRAICLRNDHELGLLNGSTWLIERCSPNVEKMTAKIEVSSTDDHDEIECSTWLHHFMAREDELSGFGKREHQEFGYGYAITVHKSQGSQYDDVLLFDESRQFGADAWRHLYTGITRAAKRLTVVQ